MNVFSKAAPRNIKDWIVSGAGILALVVFCGLLMAETAKAEVVIADNGEKKSVKTNADTVRELLNEEDITYSAHDDLSHKMDTPIRDGMEITYDEADQLTVVVNDEEMHYKTTDDTINEFLSNHDLSVSQHDDTSHDKSAEITNGMVYSVDKALDIAIIDAGEKQDAEPTTSKNVEQILEDNDIELDDSDRVSPSLNEKVNKGDKIKITRVDKTKETVDEPIDYETEKRNDDSLKKGKTKVIDEGEKGIAAKTYEVTMENGEEVNRELVDKEVKQESQTKVVAHGTKEKASPSKNSKSNVTKVSNDTKQNEKNPSSNNNNNSHKTLEMNATAYTMNCAGCDGEGYTATGINLHENPKVVSVDPNVIPLGSRVWVEGYGKAIAGDTGSAIQGNRIDLHFQSKSEALSFGRQTVEVKILD